MGGHFTVPHEQKTRLEGMKWLKLVEWSEVMDLMSAGIEGSGNELLEFDF